jgi:uncharacterized protein (TIGR00369 family)
MADPSSRARTVEWEDPRPTAARSREMSGLELLEAIRVGRLPPPPIAVLMGFSILELAEGRVTFTVVPAEYHYNPIGVVHGGLAATLLDSAMGCAVHTTLPAGWSYGTLDLSVRFVRPITRDTGRIRCEGVVVHRGSKTATTEARVWAEGSGKLLAHGTGAALLLPVAVAE